MGHTCEEFSLTGSFKVGRDLKSRSPEVRRTQPRFESHLRLAAYTKDEEESSFGLLALVLAGKFIPSLVLESTYLEFQCLLKTS